MRDSASAFATADTNTIEEVVELELQAITA